MRQTMEKTNKCLVQFACVGSKATCKYAEPYPPEYAVVGDHLRKFCKCYYGGNCTNKKAQIQALQDEGFEVNN